jgi:hypothetical protein
MVSCWCQREQAQQQTAAQRVAIDHLAGRNRGELGAEPGQELRLLEHVEQIQGARAADHLVLDRDHVLRLGQRRQLRDADSTAHRAGS